MDIRDSLRPATIVRRIRNRHLFFMDIILIILGAWLSFDMRLETLIPPLHDLNALLAYLLVALLVRLWMFHMTGIYKCYWLFASIEELRLLTLSITGSTFIIAVTFLGVLLPLDYVHGLPRSALLIDWLVSLGLLGGSRCLIRILGNVGDGAPHVQNNGDRSSVLIAGAGEAGSMIVRQLVNNPQLGLQAVGFVDDDPAKWGVRVHGVPVLGSRKDLPWLILKYNISQVIIAMPAASGAVLREIHEICRKIGDIDVRTVPGIYEILAGQVSLQHVREVQIEDLLRREPVETDTHAIRGYLYHKRVAITGAGGSIGSELCRQIAAIEPSLLLLIGHGENSIFTIEQEMRRNFPAIPVQPIIVDIRDRERLTWVFRTWQPQIVFHAAAHKHVPLMECNVVEAVTNNILGTRNVVRAATGVNVERLVMISSDKAVHPSSIMGASKRIAEMVVQEAALRMARPYVVVRFGNVLGSRGSVIPLFKEQIKAGGPVTVTHPEMTRYFMTIPEAVHLVLQAGVLGMGSEIFVLDMGQPVKVLDLAKDLIELSGFKPNEDIDIIFTGIRPGEKLHETLFYSDEMQAGTAHEKILVTQNNHGQAAEDLEEVIKHLEQLAHGQREAEILAVFQEVLPDYRAAEVFEPPAQSREQPAPRQRRAPVRATPSDGRLTSPGSVDIAPALPAESG